VIFPGIGRVSVAGLTPSAAEAAIRRGLEANQLKSATVMLERSSPARETSTQTITAFFSGSVSSPGKKVLSYIGGRRPTVYQGILEAGGFSRFADQRRVTVTRNTGQGRSTPIEVNIEQVRQGKVADLSLGDGDIVTVKEKIFGW
jgi:protein involved in polysaccharide export with SLBB domain